MTDKATKGLFNLGMRLTVFEINDLLFRECHECVKHFGGCKQMVNSNQEECSLKNVKEQALSEKEYGEKASEAIARYCYWCFGGSNANNSEKKIKNCKESGCPLHQHRLNANPYDYKPYRRYRKTRNR